jgi:hypothetical protein
MSDDYVIQKSSSSLCGQCEKPLDLLCFEFAEGPMFYICWFCKRVTEVGKGEVRREDQ